MMSDPTLNHDSYSKKNLKRKIAALRKQLLKRKQLLNKLDSYHPQTNYSNNGLLQSAYLSNNQLTI
jgi:hypothetical protein